METPIFVTRNVKSRKLFENVLPHENARPHMARRTTDFIQEAGVNVLPWPSRSSDLNPIKHVWDMMGAEYSLCNIRHRLCHS
ncbi:unnamed protein product [Acanthoscelides obtectus]|uniref:Transposase n=1 Tax=Acanthoscelides obtectus TaxID=200917 RepID=A0A9P0Q1C2_ACAOB|nr:unnamed protein product [Acanthoscelides obtectus]CAK1642373.1 hypothetical protein AOBTE_LOCUS13004 [Acanthoscelides obtectus]